MSERIWIEVGGRAVAIEIERVGASSPHPCPLPRAGEGVGGTVPTVVFLHEGLGSVSMWRGFAERFCVENGFAGLLYSRLGYGRSTVRPRGEPWGAGFMHDEALEVLPRVLAATGTLRPWLFGHSDGGSIALLHAARFPVSGLVVVAPHVFVDDIALTSIAKTRAAYDAGGPLRERLARYHDDVDATFLGWTDTWLSSGLRSWNIEAELGRIAAPVLAVQGDRDEYGDLGHLATIERRLPKTRLLVLPDCGHSPHRDCTDALVREAGRFIRDHTVLS